MGRGVWPCPCINTRCTHGHHRKQKRLVRSAMGQGSDVALCATSRQTTALATMWSLDPTAYNTCPNSEIKHKQKTYLRVSGRNLLLVVAGTRRLRGGC